MNTLSNVRDALIDLRAHIRTLEARSREPRPQRGGENQVQRGERHPQPSGNPRQASHRSRPRACPTRRDRHRGRRDTRLGTPLRRGRAEMPRLCNRGDRRERGDRTRARPRMRTGRLPALHPPQGEQGRRAGIRLHPLQPAVDQTIVIICVAIAVAVVVALRDANDQLDQILLEELTDRNESEDQIDP